MFNDKKIREKWGERRTETRWAIWTGQLQPRTGDHGSLLFCSRFHVFLRLTTWKWFQVFARSFLFFFNVSHFRRLAWLRNTTILLESTSVRWFTTLQSVVRRTRSGWTE